MEEIIYDLELLLHAIMEKDEEGIMGAEVYLMIQTIKKLKNEQQTIN